MSSMSIGDEGILPGTKQFVKLKVATVASGATLELPVHIVNGAEKGPRLLLMGGIHGNTWPSIEYVRRIVMDTSPSGLAGTLIVVPVVNALAYESGTRLIPVGDFSYHDLNRVFPGDPKGSLSTRIASVLTKEVVKKADCVIDFHSAPLSRMAYCGTEVGKGSSETSKRAFELARAYGLNILETDQPAGSCVSYCSELGVPAFEVRCGSTYFGVGSTSPEFFVERNVTGIQNVMKVLGMIEGKVVEPRKQVLVKREHRTIMYAANGGFFCPEIGIDRLGDFVKEGEPLGKTISPYSFEELESFKAPYDGICYVIRGPGPIHVGDLSYAVADLKEVVWVKKTS